MVEFTLSQESDLHHLQDYLSDLNDVRLSQFSEDISLPPVADYDGGFEGIYAAPPVYQREVVVNNYHMSSTGILPCMDIYKGPLDFEIFLDGWTSHKKSWVYSNTLQKVFLDMNKELLIQFKTNKTEPGLRIRALPVYTSADNRRLSVNRCTVHSIEVDPQRLAHKEEGKCLCADYQWVGHVIKSTHQGVHYDYNPQSGRHSISVPLDSVQPGCDTVTVPYYFTCKTSCIAGMNRKPIDIIFTLETSLGEVIGRQTLSFKICSCPKRDQKREEKDDEVTKDDAKRLGLETPVRQGKRKIECATKGPETKIIKEEKAPTPPNTTNTNDISKEQLGQILTEFTDQIDKMACEMKEEFTGQIDKRAYEMKEEFTGQIDKMACEMKDRITQLQNMVVKIEQLFSNNNDTNN